jgi:secreted trypsin-like serine protease
VAISDGEVIPLKDKKGDLYGWTGTGYLISDGRFITAKHCVEGWKFMTNEDIAEAISSLDEVSSLLYFAGLANAKGVNLRTIIFAKSPSKEFEFSSDQFVMNHSDEKSIKFTDEYTRKVASLVSGADWAYVKTGQAGKIPADASLSANLPAGARLEVLGYPMGDQTSEGSCLYGSCQTSERGLRNGLIMISARNFEQGNSGGPVFYLDKDGYKAVGIVSMGKGDTRGGLIPLSNLR